MSENQNRGTADFAKYDMMTTEELEEILRSDSQSPEGQESDGELLLYVMGVLAHRKRNSENPGKTAQQAWESFEKHYLPKEEVHTAQRKSKKVRPSLRRWIAAVAAAAFIVAIPLTASALTWDEIWNAVATWAKETFSFVSQPDATQATEPSPDNIDGYESLQQALAETNRGNELVPTWIPDRYTLMDITVEENPMRKNYGAIYLGTDGMLMITVQSYIGSDPEKIEINEDLLELYTVADNEYYIFSNVDQLRAVWISGSYECSISGNITMEEIKLMIDSIVKG
ncbi:MAG: DUF4367 domain-containing protein [Oscillospiraceae bacterium]|nr:DUF4367 domain-containing protein [Oscillospiraceae bacterium]